MKNILVIDDDEDIREVICFALESEGFKVLAAENGLAGLNLLLDSPPEKLPGLIIVDYLMPEMDGLEFVSHIKTTHKDQFGLIPIVLSSAMGEIELDNNVLFKDVIKLFKPLDLEELLEVARKNCS